MSVQLFACTCIITEAEEDEPRARPALSSTPSHCAICKKYA